VGLQRTDAAGAERSLSLIRTVFFGFSSSAAPRMYGMSACVRPGGTSKGNKAHGRQGAARLETVVRCPDSTAEKSLEVEAPIRQNS
jgi:hypothetical protein